MNLMRVLLAALGAFVAYFAAGGLMFVTMPWMKKESEKYPAVYRPSEGQMKNMPVAMAATLVAIGRHGPAISCGAFGFRSNFL